jgi:hypothetical protein
MRDSERNVVMHNANFSLDKQFAFCICSHMSFLPASPFRIALRNCCATARPWMERQDGDCAYIVSGEGYRAIACGAPGRPRKRGWGSYCPSHAAEIYRTIQKAKA